ncbi:MAG: DNA polymerase Y family protein [Myxococcales bacterium]|nr:DNA polymerase Y family protein [Myxococcales bacterium]MCB9530320.1 DNA polymerase Y family protein [Myxococcales bacterium]MCB9534150.1 DNA polymerase Y family protein [Myxococcales bacterium]
MTELPTIACVNVPALPLQVLARRHADWVESPMAVVDADRPTGRVCWVSQRAWTAGVRPGMRYAAALSLCGELRAGEVSVDEVRGALDGLARELGRFSPSVERSAEHEGVFWVDVRGLGRLYSSLEQWADALERALTGLGYRSTLVVGYDRFSVYALAVARHRVRVSRSREEEASFVRRVPLERLRLEPGLLAALDGLGLRTLGELIRLPRAQVSRRLGAAAERLYVQLREGSSVPVQAEVESESRRREVQLGYAERDSGRILRRVESELPGLMGVLLAAGEVLVELRLGFELERAVGERAGVELEESIRPATPTLDEGLILDLVRLRLDSVPVSSGVVRLWLEARSRVAVREQGSLLSERPRRDLAVANRALAQLRAEFGDGAVGAWVCGDGHLVDVATRWEPFVALRPAKPRQSGGEVSLIRRVFGAPQALPPRPRQEPDGWLVRGPRLGPVVWSSPEQIVAGGWWATEVQREYRFLETSKGHLLWAFFDRRRRRWFLHGVVE